MPVETRSQGRKRWNPQASPDRRDASSERFSPKPLRTGREETAWKDDTSGSEDEERSGGSFSCGSRKKPVTRRERCATTSTADSSGRRSTKEPTYMYPMVKLGVIFIGIIGCMLVFPYLSTSNITAEGNLRPQDAFMSRLRHLKAEFPSQREAVWDMVEAVVTDTLSDGSQPQRPIVLLLGSLPDAVNTTRCLVKKLSESISEALYAKGQGPSWIDGGDFKDQNADDAKFELDKRLTDDFANGRRVATILHLDALPPCSILLFHSYCENDNARYKKAAFIFTVTLPSESHPAKRASGPALAASEDSVSEHLTRTWLNQCDKLTQAKVDAMLSRIANNVYILHKEPVVPCDYT